MVYSTPTPLEIFARRRIVNGLGNILTDNGSHLADNAANSTPASRPHSTKTRDQDDRSLYNMNRSLSGTAAEGRSERAFFPDTPSRSTYAENAKNYNICSSGDQSIASTEARMVGKIGSNALKTPPAPYPAEEGNLNKRRTMQPESPRTRLEDGALTSAKHDASITWRMEPKSKHLAADLRDEIAEGRSGGHTPQWRQPRDLSEDFDERFPRGGTGGIVPQYNGQKKDQLSRMPRFGPDDGPEIRSSARYSKRLYLPKLGSAESDSVSAEGEDKRRLSGKPDKRISAMLAKLGDVAEYGKRFQREGEHPNEEEIQVMKRKYDQRMDAMRHDYEEKMLSGMNRIEDMFEREISSMDEKANCTKTDRKEAIAHATFTKHGFEQNRRSKESLVVETYQREIDALERQLEECECNKAEDIKKVRQEHSDTIYSLRKEVEETLKGKNAFVACVNEEVASIQNQFLEDMDAIKAETIRNEQAKWKEEIGDIVNEAAETIEYMRQKHAAEVENLELVVADGHTLLSRLEDDLNTTEEMATKSEKQNENNILLLQNEVNDLKHNSSEIGSKYSMQLENIETELQETLRENDRLVVELPKLQEENMHLRNELNQSKEKVIHQSKNISNLQRDFKDTESQAKDAERALWDCTKQLEREGERNREYKMELEDCRRNIIALEEKERSLDHSECSNLENELMGVRAERESALRRIHSLEDSVEDCIRGIESERVKGKMALEKATTYHAEEIETLQRQVAQSTASLDEIQDLVSVLKKDCDREVRELKTELAATKRREEELEQFIRDRLNTFERENMQRW